MVNVILKYVEQPDSSEKLQEFWFSICNMPQPIHQNFPKKGIKTAKKKRVKQQLQKKRRSEKEGKPCSKVVQYLGYERRGNHEMMRVKLAIYFLLTLVLRVKPKKL